MARPLRFAFTLLFLSLCNSVLASSPNTRLRFRALSFTNSSTVPSSTTSSSTGSTTSSSSSTVTLTPEPELQSTTIVEGNSTIVGLPGPTITAPPNFDLTGLGALDPALSSYIVEHGLYSINWADLIGFANGSLIFNQPSLAPNSSACPTFWVFPEPTSDVDPDEVTIVEIVTVYAEQPAFCGTATFTPPPPTPPPPPPPRPTVPPGTVNGTVFQSATEVEATSTVAFSTPATKKTTVTVWEPAATPKSPESKKNTVNGAQISTANVNFGTPSQPTPVVSGVAENIGNSAVVKSFNDGIASAIAQLFPGSSPDQPKNPPPPGKNGIVSDVIGAYIASVFAGGIPGSNIPPVQQGQVNGISYSVGPTAVVVDGKTYSPATPTVVTLPDGHTVIIGQNGLSIDNNFIPINPAGSLGSPSQGIINGVPYSLAPNGIVISGTTYSTSQPTSVTLPNGQTLVIGANGMVQIGGTPVPVSWGLGPTTKLPLGLGVVTATSTRPITTSHSTSSSSSGTVSSTGSTSKTTTTSASKTAATASPKKGAAAGDRDLLSLGTVLIVGLSSILIAWL